MQGRAIEIPGAPPRYPLVCAPLVARTTQALLEEARAVTGKQPDLLEWRVDFFDGIGDTRAVIETLAAIRACGLPVLFTRRSVREGGEAIALSEDAVVQLYGAVCGSGHATWVDFEMGNEAAHVEAVRNAAKAAGVQLVLSFHDFHATPPADQLQARFETAQRLVADVAKVAVMPRTIDDVLVLLTATAQASRALSIPVISMAMGPLGALTRVAGFAFGSAMTFAVGQGTSAPGQLPIEDVRACVQVLGRGMVR